MLENPDLMASVSVRQHSRSGWILSFSINKMTYVFVIPGGNGETWYSNWEAFMDSNKTELFSSWPADSERTPLPLIKVDELPARIVLAGTVFEFPLLDVPPLRFDTLDRLTDNDILERFDGLARQKILSPKYRKGSWTYMVNSIREIKKPFIFDCPVLSTTDGVDFWNV